MSRSWKNIYIFPASANYFKALKTVSKFYKTRKNNKTIFKKILSLKVIWGKCIDLPGVSKK